MSSENGELFDDFAEEDLNLTDSHNGKWVDIAKFTPEEGIVYDLFMPGAKLTAIYIGKDGQWQSGYTSFLYTIKSMLATGYTKCKINPEVKNFVDEADSLTGM